MSLHCFFYPNGVIEMMYSVDGDRDNIIMIIPYNCTRQFLVALVFADFPSLPPFISLVLSTQVMECNWAGLLRKVRTAQDLDQIITAHDTFLQHITSQCLLDLDSQVHTHPHP